MIFSSLSVFKNMLKSWTFVFLDLYSYENIRNLNKKCSKVLKFKKMYTNVLQNASNLKRPKVLKGSRICFDNFIQNTKLSAVFSALCDSFGNFFNYTRESPLCFFSSYKIIFFVSSFCFFFFRTLSNILFHFFILGHSFFWYFFF